MNDYGDTLQGILGARLGPAHPVYGLGVAVIARQRAAIGGVVMALEQVAHEGVPLACREVRSPRLDAFGTVQRAQQLELFRQRLGIAHEVRVVLPQQRDARRHVGLQAEAA